MDFFSNSKPDLVGPKVKKSVFKIIKNGGSDNATISDKISSMLESIYKDYISENKLIFSLLVLTVIFLLYRYYSKGRKSDEDRVPNDEKEKFSPEEKKIINEIMNEQTSHLKYDEQPSFNPLYSVNEQQKQNVNYPPEELPVNIPGRGIEYTKSLYDNYPSPYQNLNVPQYDYGSVYDNPRRSYYSGTFKPYMNAVDTNIINPFDWSNNFNTNTGYFVNGMNNANVQNVIDYKTMMNNMQGSLVDGLKVGPEYLNEIPEVEPPYADM